MVHRSLVGEFRIGHTSPWYDVHLVDSRGVDEVYQYILARDFIQSLLNRYLLRHFGFFFDSFSMKKLGNGCVFFIINIYRSRVNFSLRKFIYGLQKFYRRRRFTLKPKYVGLVRLKNIFIKTNSLVDICVVFLRWIFRGKLLGLVVGSWDSFFFLINLIFSWINSGLEKLRVLKNRIKVSCFLYRISKLVSTINLSLNKLLGMSFSKTQIRFVRERDVSSVSLAHYMGYRLSEGYPIHIVFGFVVKQLRRKYKRLKYNDLFGLEKLNCLGFAFKLSGRLSRRLRAKVMRRHAGKLFVSNFGWLPRYEGVQVKTKYGTCGLRVWLLYKSPYRSGLVGIV